MKALASVLVTLAAGNGGIAITAAFHGPFSASMLMGTALLELAVAALLWLGAIALDWRRRQR